jgi:hypothetical protein
VSGRGCQFLSKYVFKDGNKWIEHIYEHIYLLTHFIYKHIYCLLLNVNLLSTGLWYEKYGAYGKVCTEMFLVNVRSVHVLPRVVDAKLMQSKLDLDFIKFTNDLFCIRSISMSMDTFSTCSRTFQNFVRFFSQSPTQFAQIWQIQYFIPLSVLFERFCIDWQPGQHDGTMHLWAMAALSWLSSRLWP